MNRSDHNIDAVQAIAARVIELDDELRVAEKIRAEADNRVGKLTFELFKAKKELTQVAYNTSFVIGERVVIVTTAVAHGVIIQPVHQA